MVGICILTSTVFKIILLVFGSAVHFLKEIDIHIVFILYYIC